MTDTITQLMAHLGIRPPTTQELIVDMGTVMREVIGASDEETQAFIGEVAKRHALRLFQERQATVNLPDQSEEVSG